MRPGGCRLPGCERRWLITEREGGDTPFAAPPDALERSLEFLTRQRRSVPPGSFVFMLSDFLAPPPTETLLRGISYGWDLVPVVIQDPVWEQSFPAATGVGLPIADPQTDAITLVRLSRRQAASRAEANEHRFAGTLADFQALDLEPVVIGTTDPDLIDEAFIAWAQRRTSSAWVR